MGQIVRVPKHTNDFGSIIGYGRIFLKDRNASLRIIKLTKVHKSIFAIENGMSSVLFCAQDHTGV